MKIRFVAFISFVV